MDSKIIGLIAGSLLLTGCATSKVERLHSTTTQLSTGVDSYVTLTNKVVDFNEKYSLYIDGKQRLELKMKTPLLGMSQKEKEDYNEKNFNRFFLTEYKEYSLGEDARNQSADLSEYFKILPKSLESENLDTNFEGLVNNIDILNKSIEEKIPKDVDGLKGNLTPVEKDLINKIFMEAYKAHQYNQFDERIKDQYIIILQAIINLKDYTHYTLSPVASGLNKDFEDSHQALLASYKKQQKEANLSPAKKSKAVYSNEDLNKFYELFKQPIVPNSSSNFLTQEKPQQGRSKLYTEFCRSNLSLNNYYKIEWYDKNPSNQPIDYSFDFEKILLVKGSEPSCELIDILGLLLEKKYNQIDLKNFEKKTADFNNIVDFLMKKLPSEKKEK
jgi:hypothetical protein